MKFLIIASICLSSIHAFKSLRAIKSLNHIHMNLKTNNENEIFNPFTNIVEEKHNNELIKLGFPSALALSLCIPSQVNAFTAIDHAIPSGLVAYGHYLGLVLVSMSLAIERITIKPSMTVEEEDRLTYADIVYGIAGVIILATGYFRVTEFGKGWDFYSHEPIFWVKLLLFMIMGSSSLFPTIKIIQRAVDRKNGIDVPPMSQKVIVEYN